MTHPLASFLLTLTIFFCSISVRANDPWPDRVFAPYVDATLNPTFNIVDGAVSHGVTHYILAFIVADGTRVGQDPLTLPTEDLAAWGAFTTLGVKTEFQKTAIESLRLLGGDVMISFGGASNTELAGLFSNTNTAGSAAWNTREAQNVQKLKETYQYVIDTYGLTYIDFDIEGKWVSDPYSIVLRSKAIKALQDDAAAANRALYVWYTLPVLPTGLDYNGRNVLNAALDAGVALDGINVMAMDYGPGMAPIIDPATGVQIRDLQTHPNVPPRELDNPSLGDDANATGMMGDYGIQAAQSLVTQLDDAYSSHAISKTNDDLWRMVGITPMLGVNDQQDEVIDPTEFDEILYYSIRHKVGLLSYWSITRDHPAPTPAQIGQVSPNHSGLAHPDFTFARLGNSFTGDEGEAIYIRDAEQIEGQSGTNTLSVTVLRLPASSQSRTVQWNTSDGTALAGVDYVASTGSVTFAADQESLTLSIPILGELQIEADEYFMINLSSSAVRIADAQAQAWILDDDTLPALSVSDIEISETNATVTLTVSLDLPPAAGHSVQVQYTTAPGTALADTDYLSTSGTLDFPAGIQEQSVTLSLINDSIDETREAFFLRLSSPTQATLAKSEGTITLIDDDYMPAGGYAFVVDSAWNGAWQGQLIFINSSLETWTDWGVEFDAPWTITSIWGASLFSSNPPHYVLHPPVWGAPIAPGATHSIGFIATTPESAPTNVTINGQTVPPLSPGISINDLSISSEGDSGTQDATFTISLSETSTESVHVSYTTANGSATADADYTPVSGTLVFPVGTTTRSVIVSVLGDLTIEETETVLLLLAGVDGETPPRITDNTGTLSITDDDAPAQLSVFGDTLVEGDSGTQTATIRIHLNRAPTPTESVEVDYATVAIRATENEDYTAQSGTLSIPSGQSEATLELTIHGDTTDERFEDFELRFSNPKECTLVNDSAQIQIVDNDTPRPLGTHRVVAYVDGTSGGQIVPPADRVTHIFYAFSNLGADGQLAVASPEKLQLLTDLRDTQNPALKILVSIGGWTWSGHFSTVAGDPALRAAFVQSVTNTIVTYQIDGVDIDWEWPGGGGLAGNASSPDDTQNFTLLLEETRAALDQLDLQRGRHHLLTFFAPGGLSKIANLELPQIAEHLDFLTVQGYDLRGPWDTTTGHHIGLYPNPSDPGGNELNSDAIINRYLQSGIESDKLLVGAAFYGRSISGALPGNNGLFQTHNGGGNAINYYELRNNLLTKTLRHWDDTAKAPWIYNPTTGVFTTYDDPESIAEKAAYVRARHLGGLFFWRLAGDSADQALLIALHDGLSEPFKIYPTTPTGPHSFSWIASTGHGVEVQYTLSLDSPDWESIATGITTGSYTDTDPIRTHNEHGFYRIIEHTP